MDILAYVVSMIYGKCHIIKSFKLLQGLYIKNLRKEKVMETAITTITAAMPNVFALVETVLTEILGNPLLVLPMAVSFAGLGVGVYKMFKSAV